MTAGRRVTAGQRGTIDSSGLAGFQKVPPQIQIVLVCRSPSAYLNKTRVFFFPSPGSASATRAKVMKVKDSYLRHFIKKRWFGSRVFVKSKDGNWRKALHVFGGC